MAKLSVKGGTTSFSTHIFIQDSSQTDGRGLIGLAYNTASLVASYVRPLAARASLPLVTQTVTGAYSSGGFVEVDATNMPGVYRLDIPDAALAAGRSVVVMLKGAANMAPVALEIDLLAQVDAVAWNALPTVALPLIPATPGRTLVVDAAGLADANVVKAGPTGSGVAVSAWSATRGLAGTAVPAAAADAPGGLVVSDAGGLDIDALAALIVARLAKLADAGFTAATFATDTNLYSATCHLTDKNAATATDRYSVKWFKNGVWVTSGITVPTIKVVKYADGTELFAATALSPVALGFDGLLRKDITATLASRGEAYEAILVATIDGVSRTFPATVTRDASA